MERPFDPPDVLDDDLSDVLAHTDWLRALARRLVGDVHAADDVVQDTLVAALRRPRSLREAAAPRLRAWLAVVARNFARRRARASEARSGHERMHAEDAERSRAVGLGGARAAEPAAFSGDGADAGDALDLVRTQKRLVDAVLDLREPYRTAVVLRFQRGLSNAELADELGLTAAAARQRVSRGLALVRERLDREERERGGTPGAWCAAFLVFGTSGPPRDAAAASLLTSSLTLGGIVGTKTVLAAGAALLLVTTWVLMRPESEAISPSSGVAEPAAAAVLTPTEASPSGAPSQERTPDPAGVEPVPPTGSEATASIDPDRLLRGRVLTVSGEPVAGARVELSREELRAFVSLDLGDVPRRGVLARTESADDGSFELDVTPGLPFDVRADHPGFAPGRALEAKAGQTVELVLAAPATFSARVRREDGSPVVGARVEGRGTGGLTGFDSFEGVTDEDGRYTAEGLEAGTVRVQVVPEKDGLTWGHRFELVAGQTTEWEAVVNDGYEVRGQVVDAETGRPIAGATVGAGWVFAKSAQTDENGEFELLGYPLSGYPEIHARAPGYGGTSQSLPGEDEGQGNRRTVAFALRPAVRAQGRVVDERGAPIAEAYVSAVSENTNWRSTRAGADGTFEVEDLEPGAIQTLFVVAEGFGACAFEFPGEPLEAGAYALGNVALRDAALLSGRVVDLDGAPIPNIDVHLRCSYDDRLVLSGPLGPRRQLNCDFYVAMREGRTGPAGEFAFGDLAPGRYTLAASRGGSATGSSDPILVRAGERVDGVVIEMDAGVSVSGRVVDESGEPVAGVCVMFRPESQRGGSLQQLFTTAEGRFEGSGLPTRESYRIDVMPFFEKGSEARVRGILREGVDLARETEFLFVLPPADPVTGVVVDASGAPREGVVVDALAGDELLASSRTNADGAFTLLLEPGTWSEVRARVPLRWGDSGPEVIGERIEVAPGSRDVRIVLEDPKD